MGLRWRDRGCESRYDYGEWSHHAAQDRPTVGAVLGANPMIAGASFPASTRVAPKRLLILGGTGFIGPHMVDYALRRGHE